MLHAELFHTELLHTELLHTEWVHTELVHTELVYIELVYIERNSRSGDFLIERREVSSRMVNRFFSHVVLIERQVRSCSVINFDDVPCLFHVRSCPELSRSTNPTLLSFPGYCRLCLECCLMHRMLPNNVRRSCSKTSVNGLVFRFSTISFRWCIHNFVCSPVHIFVCVLALYECRVQFQNHSQTFELKRV